MKIFSRGSGSGSSFNRRQGNRQGARSFARRHRPGDIVRGRVAAIENNKMAWIVIDGDQLLASIASNPRPGQELYFKVLEITPEIRLQELRGNVISAVPLGTAVPTYWSLRNKFESEAAALLNQLAEESTPEQEPEVTRKRFFALLAENSSLARRFLEVEARRTELNVLLPEDGSVQCLYMPWLIPEAVEFDMLCAKKRSGQGEQAEQAAFLYELSCDFRLPHLGQCRIQLYYREPDASYRVHVRGREAMELLTRLGEQLAKNMGDDSPTYLGCSFLPADSSGLLNHLVSL